jgi:hypothetical protein
MKFNHLPLATGLLLLASAGTAKSDLLYTFNTIAPAGEAGSVTASFEVADQAIKKGFLTSSDLFSSTMSISGASADFGNAPTQAVFPDIISQTSDPWIDVESAAFIVLQQAASSAQPDLQQIMDAIKEINDQKQSFRELIDLPLAPGVVSFDVEFAIACDGCTDPQGTGTWTVNEVQSVPEPSSVVLFGWSGLLAATAMVIRRRKIR